jgi:hypothetical protein
VVLVSAGLGMISTCTTQLAPCRWAVPTQIRTGVPSPYHYHSLPLASISFSLVSLLWPPFYSTAPNSPWQSVSPGCPSFDIQVAGHAGASGKT